MFEPCFAPLVKSGKKKCTIRKKGRREINVGDLMDARMWSGRPYCSKTVKLIEAPITKIADIYINSGLIFFSVIVDGLELELPEITKLAGQDGFSNVMDFLRFFRDKYGLPFEGQIIHWD